LTATLFGTQIRAFLWLLSGVDALRVGAVEVVEVVEGSENEKLKNLDGW